MGRDPVPSPVKPASKVSIHAPRVGRDSYALKYAIYPAGFNPRAPCGARPPPATSAKRLRCFNPRAPCGARQDTCRKYRYTCSVSIHAPRVGRDSWRLSRRRWRILFQSTRPMRGATLCLDDDAVGQDVSIHAPHAGRDHRSGHTYCWPVVSIHAPHAGRDYGVCPRTLHQRLFQSTRPMRGATHGHAPHRRCRNVSIHAPHAGRDVVSFSVLPPCGCFNPRAPCGARRRPR